VGGPPAWRLGGEPTTPRHKKHVMKCYIISMLELFWVHKIHSGCDVISTGDISYNILTDFNILSNRVVKFLLGFYIYINLSVLFMVIIIKLIFDILYAIYTYRKYVLPLAFMP
jgi:hypothetical protein